MNSYDVVKRAIEFKKPDRLPFEYDIFGVCDTHSVPCNQIGAGDLSKKKSLDEWGCLWVRNETQNMGQIKGHPIHDWSLADKYRFPDADNPDYFTGMEERFKGSDGKYISTDIYLLLFERMHALRGFENTLMDLYLERENIEKLADRIVEFNIRLIENISSRFPGQIHALKTSDDWGTELASFINPTLWDEFFKPRYKRIFDACKKAGWHSWLHCCGKVNELLDGLIESGVDVMNLQQPRVLGIEEIGRKFSGKVCFSTTCDIQHTLPFKGEKEITEEAKLLIDCWGNDHGGLIISEYGDGRAIGVSDDKKKIMFDAFVKYDRWKKNSLMP